MRRTSSARAFAAVALLFALLLAGCGGGGRPPAPLDRPTADPSSDAPPSAAQIGYPGLATKNTSRVAGADPVSNAAAIAQAVYPGQAAGARPPAVVLTDGHDWRTALASSVFMSAPLRAPLLFGDDTKLPDTTARAFRALAPTGSSAIGGAGLIRVGNVAAVPGLKSVDVRGSAPYAIASEIDRLLAAAAGRTSDSVIVVSAAAPEYAAPAAGYAAKSGTPILFVDRDGIPAPTKTAIARHQRPRIYVLGPPSTVGDKVFSELGKLGTATRIDGPDPVRNAIAFARYPAPPKSDPAFGWRVDDPGHGFVFVNVGRPLDAAAAAPLSASGSYGPLIPLPAGNTLPAALQSYLLDVEPGYSSDPVRGVYNRAWLVGDTGAISLPVQAAADRLLEIAPVKTPK